MARTPSYLKNNFKLERGISMAKKITKKKNVKAVVNKTKKKSVKAVVKKTKKKSVKAIVNKNAEKIKKLSVCLTYGKCVIVETAQLEGNIRLLYLSTDNEVWVYSDEISSNLPLENFLFSEPDSKSILGSIIDENATDADLVGDNPESRDYSILPASKFFGTSFTFYVNSHGKIELQKTLVLKEERRPYKTAFKGFKDTLVNDKKIEENRLKVARREHKRYISNGVKAIKSITKTQERFEKSFGVQ